MDGEQEGQGWDLAEVKAAIAGRKVTGARVSKSDLVLTTDSGPVWYISSGGCCPCSFESIVGVRALLNGGPVVEVRLVRDNALEVTDDVLRVPELY